MASITGRLPINIVNPAPPPPPPAGTSMLEFVPPIADIEPGKSLTVQVMVKGANGVAAIPTSGVLVPSWFGTNGGISCFVVAGYKLRLDVPIGSAPLAGLSLTVELR